MRYTPRDGNEREGALYNTLEPVVKGLGMSLVELSLSRYRGAYQVRITVAGKGSLGTDDCSRLHRALLPRLELALPGQELYLEVSSPGIDRRVKDASEFAFFIGRGAACYRTDISGWTRGVIRAADEKTLTLENRDGVILLPYENIGKARLDSEIEI
ncbi:MAG: ribosome assembly cofactor RimP [Treponema sp.]|jgi:ribosome maturation factor RimP|nr:ribosome assembly cofactor RimP [Treponema sp.]